MQAHSNFGLLSAQSIRQFQALDSAVNNVANADTPGFKAVMLTFLPDRASPWKGKVPTSPRETTNFTQGNTISTGNPLDMAIVGEGFFTVETPQGLAYTRDGRFSLNSRGEMVNMNGHLVTGDKGVIVIDGDHVDVDRTGAIQVDGEVVDTLRIVRFQNPAGLTRMGEGMYLDGEGRAGALEDGESVVKNRALEQSNVSVLEEMVRFIEINRVFESYQKVMHTIQDMNQLSTNRVGRVG